MSGTPKAAGGGPPPPPPSGQAKPGAPRAPLPPPPAGAAMAPSAPAAVPVAPAPPALPRLLTLSVPVPPRDVELATEQPSPAPYPETGAAAAAEGEDRKRTTMEFLLELDMPGHESQAKESKRTTAEFLFELDAPARAISLEIDVDADPEIEAALAQASAPSADVNAEGNVQTDSAEALTEPDATHAPDAPAMPAAAARPARERVELLVSLQPQGIARGAAEQLQQRLRRVVVRVLTCRDCFRWLGGLGIPDEDRKGVARIFMELDKAVPRPEGQPSIVKDPEVALKQATPEQLDEIERRITPLEDKLLLLDELVTPDTFRIQIENRKQSKKIVARYGRLLASRRFNAGQRRDRFEQIATHLLATVSENGRRQALPPERARAVLEVLVGGLRHKANEAELGEALVYLGEMLDRLDTLTTPDEFFDGGYFIDMHGYKVMMRDHLVSAEFVYLSVLLNVEVHNRLEAFILDVARLHDSNQLTTEGTPREQIERRMREQQDAVDDMLGVKRPLPPVGRAEAPKADGPAKKKKKAKKKKARTPLFELAFDRQTIILLVAAVAILGAGGLVAFETGAVGTELVQPLSDTELTNLSPLLGRGLIKGSGDKSHFDGMVLRGQWPLLDARKRTELAEQIAKGLATRGVKNAEIIAGGAPAIEIQDSLVTFVQGGKI